MPKSQISFTTSVRFKPAQTVWLSSATAKILERRGKHIDRSAIIRGLIDGLAAARIDLWDCSTEHEIKKTIARRLGPPNGKTEK